MPLEAQQNRPYLPTTDDSNSYHQRPISEGSQSIAKHQQEQISQIAQESGTNIVPFQQQLDFTVVAPDVNLAMQFEIPSDVTKAVAQYIDGPVYKDILKRLQEIETAKPSDYITSETIQQSHHKIAINFLNTIYNRPIAEWNSFILGNIPIKFFMSLNDDALARLTEVQLKMLHPDAFDIFMQRHPSMPPQLWNVIKRENLLRLQPSVLEKISLEAWQTVPAHYLKIIPYTTLMSLSPVQVNVMNEPAKLSFLERAVHDFRPVDLMSLNPHCMSLINRYKLYYRFMVPGTLNLFNEMGNDVVRIEQINREKVEKETRDLIQQSNNIIANDNYNAGFHVRDQEFRNLSNTIDMKNEKIDDLQKDLMFYKNASEKVLDQARINREQYENDAMSTINQLNQEKEQAYAQLQVSMEQLTTNKEQLNTIMTQLDSLKTEHQDIQTKYMKLCNAVDFIHEGIIKEAKTREVKFVENEQDSIDTKLTRIHDWPKYLLECNDIILMELTQLKKECDEKQTEALNYKTKYIALEEGRIKCTNEAVSALSVIKQSVEGKENISRQEVKSILKVLFETYKLYKYYSENFNQVNKLYNDLVNVRQIKNNTKPRASGKKKKVSKSTKESNNERINESSSSDVVDLEKKLNDLKSKIAEEYVTKEELKKRISTVVSLKSQEILQHFNNFTKMRQMYEDLQQQITGKSDAKQQNTVKSDAKQQNTVSSQSSKTTSIVHDKLITDQKATEKIVSLTKELNTLKENIKVDETDLVKYVRLVIQFWSNNKIEVNKPDYSVKNWKQSSSLDCTAEFTGKIIRTSSKAIKIVLGKYPHVVFVPTKTRLEYKIRFGTHWVDEERQIINDIDPLFYCQWEIDKLEAPKHNKNVRIGRIVLLNCHEQILSDHVLPKWFDVDNISFLPVVINRNYLDEDDINPQQTVMSLKTEDELKEQVSKLKEEILRITRLNMKKDSDIKNIEQAKNSIVRENQMLIERDRQIMESIKKKDLDLQNIIIERDNVLHDKAAMKIDHDSVVKQLNDQIKALKNRMLKYENGSAPDDKYRVQYITFTKRLNELETVLKEKDNVLRKAIEIAFIEINFVTNASISISKVWPTIRFVGFLMQCCTYSFYLLKNEKDNIVDSINHITMQWKQLLQLQPTNMTVVYNPPNFDNNFDQLSEKTPRVMEIVVCYCYYLTKNHPTVCRRLNPNYFFPNGSLYRSVFSIVLKAINVLNVGSISAQQVITEFKELIKEVIKKNPEIKLNYPENIWS